MRAVQVAIAIALLLGSVERVAATDDLAGQWQCQFGFSQWDSFGNPSGSHTREFILGLYPGGQFEAQGRMGSIMGYHQFQASGQWQVISGSLIAQGQSIDTMLQMPAPFSVVGDAKSDGSLSRTDDVPNATGTGLVSRTVLVCRRYQ